MSLAHVKTENVAAVFASILGRSGEIKIGGEMIVCFGMVKVSYPEITSAVV